MIMTNKEKVEKWLDKQIKMKKDAELVLNKNLKLSNLSITSCVKNEVHLSHIREVAQILGLGVSVKPWNLENSGYDSEIYFTYKGHRFFDLENSKGVIK